MNKQEFSKALKMAKEHNYGIANISLFDGFGLPNFKPVACTLNDMAGLIAWQCFCLDGSLDNEALNEIWNCKKRFIIV
jgi:hypothetical protein